MKNILITGAGSYIGKALESYLNEFDDYRIDTLDMTDSEWKSYDFSSYDTIFHVAGIAHVKEKRANKRLYDSVNCDMAIEVATIARSHGVKQFIFMSSMSIYADHKNINITEHTPFRPKGYYGKSKLKADLAIQKMNCQEFKVAILRPPMIFGKDCKGNFPRLVKLTMKTPIFPKIKNRRSMLYIGNLCNFVKYIIDHDKSGVFFPQNPDYFCTSELVRMIADAKGKKTRFTRVFNWAVWLAYPFLKQIRKLFGNLTYDKSLNSHIDFFTENEESVRESCENILNSN